MVTLSKYKVLLRYVAVIAVCLIGIHNFYFQPDSYWETKNHNEAIALFSGTTFDPRASVYDTLSYIQSIQNGKDSTFGDSDGIHFHWDDWVDLSPGDVVLNEYRLAYPDGDLDEKLEKFASVNPYYMELYNTKVLRSTAYTYSLQSIPDRVVIMTDDDLIEVAVSGKKRLGITKNSRYSKAKVLKKLVNVNSNKGTPDGNKTITWHPFKEFNKTMIIDNEQFVFNPEVEIMKLRTKLATQSSLSPSESDYLKTLEYGNGIVESTDKYFKYPWIYSDLVRGQAHHLESSFFRRFISTRERQSVVHHMSRAWFEFANTNGIVSWINYGSLLGWVYNGLNMPWDTDVDIQIPIRQLLELARNFNRTLVIENPKYGNGKYYLEISQLTLDKAMVRILLMVGLLR